MYTNQNTLAFANYLHLTEFFSDKIKLFPEPYHSSIDVTIFLGFNAFVHKNHVRFLNPENSLNHNRLLRPHFVEASSPVGITFTFSLILSDVRRTMSKVKEIIC